MDVFGEVRSILQEPASMLSFFKLRDLFQDGTCPEEVFVYIDEHLQKWPPDILRYPPHSWLSDDGGELPAMVAFCNAFRLNTPDVGYDVVFSWLDSPRWRDIVYLALPSFRISSEQWLELGKIEALQSLVSLDLTFCDLGSGRIDAICALPFVADLQTLSVGHNGLGEDGLDALARVPWTQIETLRLRSNRIDAFSLGPLVRGEHWASLRSLDLSLNPIGQDGASRLANVEALDGVTALSLNNCNITSDGLEALVVGRGFSKLEVLDLSLCAIDDLSRNTHRLSRFQNLRALKLHANRLRVDNLEHLLADDVVPRLEELDLSVTAQGEKSLYLLAQCDRFESLRRLKFAGNYISPEGARALAYAPWLANLEAFDLGLVADAEFDVVEAFANSLHLPAELKQPWVKRFQRLCDAM